MKIRYYSALFAVIFYAASCREVGPDIALKNNQNLQSDTTYIESPVEVAQQKRVIIEEFTGVRCPNCPQGHEIITTILASNPNRVFAVSMHPINSLGAPYSFSVQDFRHTKAQDMFDYLGQIGLEPAAGIDRMLFSGESNILLEKSKWNGKVGEQLLKITPVNIYLTTRYDSISHEAIIVVELHYTQTVSEQNRLTIALIESDIVTAQLNGAVIDTFYNHKHIMRDFLTASQGDPINESLVAGRVVRKAYRQTLDSLWIPENVKAIAYVHRFEANKDVYQVAEVAIFP